MPVLRDYKMGDGSVRNVIDPDYEHRYRGYLMSTSKTPDYHRDPTYHAWKGKPKDGL